MLKIVPRKSVGAAIDYFLRDKELDDNEKRGVWMGGGASILGLAPMPIQGRGTGAGTIVTETDLRAVLTGYAPPGSDLHAGRPLNGRYMRAQPTKRRAAWDCVLSPDKGISVSALCLPDAHLDHAMAVRRAFSLATGDASIFMESLARRTHGRHKEIETGNLLIAAFTHVSSRRNDPQLHRHFLVANATYNHSPYKQRDWYALESISLYRHAREIDQVFQRELHRRLREQGLAAYMKRVERFEQSGQPVRVDGLHVAALPVDEAVCSRLSQAHRAIVAATAERWRREGRTPAMKRYENLINDRLRPPKTGLLDARTEAFERALSADEVERIVRQMGEPLRLEEIPLVIPPPPPRKELDRLLRDAGRHLGVWYPRPRQLVEAALTAAETRSDVPF